MPHPRTLAALAIVAAAAAPAAAQPYRSVVSVPRPVAPPVAPPAFQPRVTTAPNVVAAYAQTAAFRAALPNPAFNPYGANLFAVVVPPPVTTGTAVPAAGSGPFAGPFVFPNGFQPLGPNPVPAPAVGPFGPIPAPPPDPGTVLLAPRMLPWIP